ncbi:MAG: zinc ribbon domain-containing protein, partial [Thermoplasmata archaeon]|nr:zinc ribbon domain-containing protein [Thermoplasmata archaeon]
QSAEEVVENAKRDGLNVPKVVRLMENARKAYEERKYFLARELVARGKEEASRVRPMTPYGYSYEIEDGLQSSRDTMVCHRCGERISKDNTICPECGAGLDSTVCPKCHSLVPQGFMFCGKCGMHLDNVCEVCGAINPKVTENCRVCGEPLRGGPEAEELDVELIPRELDFVP